MDELELMFQSRPTMTEGTKKVHINTLKKIQSIYDINKPLHTFTPIAIKYMTDNPILSASYKKKIVSLFIVIKSTFSNDTDAELDELRKILHEYSAEMDDKRVEDFKTENTDLYDTIEEYINNINIDNSPTNPPKFIVNWLVFYLNVRNLDLLVKVVDADTTITDDTINYLVVYPTHIQYIRNTYKTSKQFGRKIIDITDPRFIYAVSLIQKNKFVLTDNPNSLGSCVKRRLYNNMNETEYLHQNITRFEGDINRIFQIQNNRGTNISTLLSSYNKSFNGK